MNLGSGEGRMKEKTRRKTGGRYGKYHHHFSLGIFSYKIYLNL